MSGEVVAWLVNDSAFTSEAEAIEEIQQWGPSGSIAIPLVKASDLDAMQAKLDAVTKDALALQGRAQRAESLLVHCRNDMLAVLASGRPTGSTDELADEIAALTDQGRAGEAT